MVNFCTLFSGSSGNSTFIKSDKVKLLVDAGKSGRLIESALCNIGYNISEIEGILITHEHSDHINGVGILSRRYDIPIYANKKTWDVMKNSLGEIKEHNIRVFETNKRFKIGDIDVKPFDIPHDAVEPVGFNFYIGSKKITTATDIGCINEALMENLKNSDILLIEANHDVEMVKVSRYPYYLKQRILGNNGHLSNETTGQLLCDLSNFGVRKVLLGHLSKENNFPELAYKAVSNILQSNNVKIGKDIKLEVALRDKQSTMFAV